MSRFTIDLSQEIETRLSEIAALEGISKAEVMRRAFALLSVAEKEKERGRSLGILKQSANGDYEIDARLII